MVKIHYSVVEASQINNEYALTKHRQCFSFDQLALYIANILKRHCSNLVLYYHTVGRLAKDT